MIVTSKYIWFFLWEFINFTMIRGAQQKLRKRRNKTGITECFCAIQLHRVEGYDSLQEDILGTISVSIKVIFS